MTTDVDLTELLEQAMERTLELMHGVCFGVVNTYDPVASRISVTPQVPLWVNGEIVTPPVLPSVPVVWPHIMKWPLGVGDVVKLYPTGYDHSNWMITGAPNVPPISTRRFSVADLVAEPVAPFPQATPPDPLSYDATWAIINHMVIVATNKASADFVALNGKVMTELDKIKTAHNTHTHPTAPDGPVSTPSTSYTPPASVAAEELKAK